MSGFDQEKFKNTCIKFAALNGASLGLGLFGLVLLLK
jgi:hypothetical protein